MIRAHMATFPKRRKILEAAVAHIAGQVDHLVVNLNEYEKVPRELAKFDNVEAVLPDEDLKDVGKFVRKAEAHDYVFLVDDDLIYPKNYVSRTIRLSKKIGLAGKAFGYHASTYLNNEVVSASSRIVSAMNNASRKHQQVDQLGTGTVMIMGEYLPSLDEMQGSQSFVDVRFARLMYERGITLWSLPRPRRIFPSRLSELDPDDRITIAGTFTKRWPQRVLDEVNVYAGSVAACSEFDRKAE